MCWPFPHDAAVTATLVSSRANVILLFFHTVTLVEALQEATGQWTWAVEGGGNTEPWGRDMRHVALSHRRDFWQQNPGALLLTRH